MVARCAQSKPQGLSGPRRQGQEDALQGKPCYYGCHTGMRSTLEWSKEEYRKGWTEVEFFLGCGDNELKV